MSKHQFQRHMNLSILLSAALAASCCQVELTSAFTFVTPGSKIRFPASPSTSLSKNAVNLIGQTVLNAGGFEWEDPEEAFDQGVKNPFKNDSEEEEDLKIDPARLLGPRLQGCNLYFIGMMGSGKTAVGDVVARREFFTSLWSICNLKHFLTFKSMFIHVIQ